VVEPEREGDNLPETVENCEDLKKALVEEKAKAEANLVGWQRAQADFINYKRFTEQEKAETLKYANVNLLANLIPVLDDIERALAAVPTEQANQTWVEGLKLIQRKFLDTLDKLGVTCINVLGEEFDCKVMEAISILPGKKDTVLLELEKGYKMTDKLVRPAKVAVGSGEEEEKKTNKEKRNRET
jgi:molecular chaperone GrpE